MPNVSDLVHLPVCFWISNVDSDTEISTRADGLSRHFSSGVGLLKKS